MAQVFIGIGSNIDAKESLYACAKELRELWPTVIFSRVYKTAPQGLTEQEDFLNAVGFFKTSESPESVKEKLQQIEGTLGKKITERFGPRTIDLDVLLYDDLVQEDSELTIPHPRMHQRRFVLMPLGDVMRMKNSHPVLNMSYKDLLEKTAGQGCTLTDIEL